MPNWAQGSMRVRGEYEQVEKFLKEGIEYNKQYDLYYIKGTTRGFIECNIYDIEDYFINFEEYNNEGIVTMPFDVKFAWDCNAEQIKLISKAYNVDVKLRLFESGEKFSRKITVINGEIIKDKEIKYDDYNWDCPFPLLGG